jgi:hypothetical protein
MARGTIEGCMSIDVRSWHREGRLHAGQCFLHTLTWMWRPTEGIAVLAKIHNNLTHVTGEPTFDCPDLG